MCEVIELAYYDSYEDYNPNYQEFEKCLNALIEDFPDNQEVLLLKLKNVYGDEAIRFIHEVIDSRKLHLERLNDEKLAEFYAELARQYYYKDMPTKAIENARIAESLNDTLDLSLLLAQNYMELNNYEEARTYLNRSIDSTESSWDLINKGDLLLNLGEPGKALIAYQYAQRDTSAWIDKAKIADALVDNKQYLKAREYLIMAIEDSYYSSASLHKLFSFDYKYSPTDSALAAYNRLNSSDFMNDAFGKYRFMMLARSPLKGWQFSDIIKIFIFLISLIFILLVPYLWILPIHYVSSYFNIESFFTIP